ncbi:MAG: DUF6067 family protein [Phycisphaerae bacterium]|jgi:hypothetical protein|nr:DUF6067 family protein [Phycisphaerae bacterium]
MTRSIKNMMIISLATVLIFAAAGIAAPLDEPGDPGSDAGGAIPRGAKNLFLKAACTADKVWSNRTPDLAVNGNRRAGDHWAGPPIPAKHTVDLKTPAKFNTIRMITYFDRRRSYQYFVEISTDGKAWKQIIDQSKNKAKATAAGRVFKFEPVTARYIRTTFTGNSQDNNSGGHIVEIEGYMIDPSAKPKPVVNATPLSGATGSVNQRYQRDSKPQLPDSKKWSTVAWRGERVHGQFVVWTGSDLKNVSLTASELKSAGGKTIPAADVIPFFVRYTMGAGQLLGDILEPNRPIDLPKNSTRPIWVSVNVPQNTVPGVYKGTLAVKGAAGNSITFEISIDVLPNVLPAPKQWSFHLDLWQNPWAVSRIHGHKQWSPEHWAKLKKVLTLAAEAGQKCLTASIVNRPWGGQTQDAFGSMIAPTRNADGTWTYDYSVFDKWVEFGFACGIDRQINCYSMVPWGNNLYYQDAASGKYVKITAKPGAKAYADYWAPLLKDFAKHLKAKGWFEKTTIAMDERHLDDMKNMIALVDKVAPGMKITLAANKNLESIIDRIHDYSFAIRFPAKPELNVKRAAKGRQTTFYVCCAPRRPNTFPFSPPAESTWLGWNAAAKRYSGLLRWAFCSYNIDPLKTTDYPRRSWPTGDCYLIYPGPRSSIRFERLREGIQDYEKIRILRQALTKQGESGAAGLAKLEAILKTVVNRDHTNVVIEAKKALVALSRETKTPAN